MPLRHPSLGPPHEVHIARPCSSILWVPGESRVSHARVQKLRNVTQGGNPVSHTGAVAGGVKNTSFWLRTAFAL